MKDYSMKKYIPIFLILAFGLPLICVFLVKSFDVFQSGTINLILYGIEASTPALAALITIAIQDGSGEVREFLRKCYFKNIKIRYIILAIALPFAVIFAAKLTSLIFVDETPLFTGITARKLVTVLWALATEEIGWRGFLQDKLNKFCGYFMTPLLTGIIWASWHYHFFLLGTMSVPLILFAYGCIADSFGYYWVTYKSKGNIIPASIWHFTGNLCFNIFLINPEYNKGSIVPYLLFVVCLTIMAVGISSWGILSSKKIVL